MNQSSIDRGLFRSSLYRTYKDEEKAVGADAEMFENPAKCDCTCLKMGCYDKLGENGIIEVGSRIDASDVIIGKTIMTSGLSAPEDAREHIKRDKSTFARNASDSIVDCVVESVTKDGNSSVKVRVRSQRIPMIGDKVPRARRTSRTRASCRWQNTIRARPPPPPPDPAKKPQLPLSC